MRVLCVLAVFVAVAFAGPWPDDMAPPRFTVAPYAEDVDVAPYGVIDTVVDMGDTFDNRRNIDLATLEWTKKNYYDRLQAMGITVHTIVGNHTAYYKDTNEINTVDLLLKEYDNVVVYSEPTTINLGGLDILMLPCTVYSCKQTLNCQIF